MHQIATCDKPPLQQAEDEMKWKVYKFLKYTPGIRQTLMVIKVFCQYLMIYYENTLSSFAPLYYSI